MLQIRFKKIKPRLYILMILAIAHQSCAQLVADLAIRAVFLPLDMTAKKNSQPAPRVSEEKKRLEKDWVIGASAQRYSILSNKIPPGFGLKLGSYIGESHSFGLFVQAIRDRKTAEADDFGKVDHEFELYSAELQYAYHFEILFVNFGVGSRYSSLLTKSHETDEKIYELLPLTIPMAGIGVGVEYQLAFLTFTLGQQWKALANPKRKREYFITAEHSYIDDALTKGLVKRSYYTETYFQIGFSPRN